MYEIPYVSVKYSPVFITQIMWFLKEKINICVQRDINQFMCKKFILILKFEIDLNTSFDFSNKRKQIWVAILRDQPEVGIEALIVRTARKGMHFFWFFLLFWESFNCYNFGTTGPIKVRFSAKYTSPTEEDFNQIEHWKCHMYNFRLIPRNRITYFHTKRRNHP